MMAYMHETGDLGKDLQPTTEDTTMKLFWLANGKIRGHSIFIQDKGEIGAGMFYTTDDKKNGVALLMTQIPIEFSQKEGDKEADVFCIERVDMQTDKVKRYFFRSSADGIRLEVFVPDPYSYVEAPSHRPSDKQEMRERLIALQQETREFERSIGFGIVFESEAQELLRLMERAVIIQL